MLHAGVFLYISLGYTCLRKIQTAQSHLTDIAWEFKSKHKTPFPENKYSEELSPIFIA